MNNIVLQLEKKIFEESPITFEEALELSKLKDLTELFKAANRIRDKFSGKRVDLCSIMNAKSGRCSEDCKYCAQSAHYQTSIKEYGLVSEGEVLALAKENEKFGVNRFSLVTSGRGLSGQEFEKTIRIYELLSKKVKVDLCASLGIISYGQLLKLENVGITMYHHNLETSREYYEKICTTHTYDERIITINNAKKAGLKV